MQRQDRFDREGAHDTKVWFEASFSDRTDAPILEYPWSCAADEKVPVPIAPLIVIVDDDAPVRRAVASLVESAGFESVSFASAEECLSSGRRAGGACLILDVWMPGMSGLQLQSHLLARDEQIPIIFISAHGDNGARAHALQTGAAAFLAKPFGDQELLDAIDSALGKS